MIFDRDPTDWSDLQNLVAKMFWELGCDIAVGQHVDLVRGKNEVDVLVKDPGTTPTSELFRWALLYLVRLSQYDSNGVRTNRECRMAQKNKAARAKKKATVRGKRLQRSRVTITGPTLERAAKQADAATRRAGQAYVEKATELEAARIAQRDAERQVAVFYAAESAQAKRPFYNFLAQGDSWFSYICGFALIHWLQVRFGPRNAYIDNIAVSGRTLRQMLSREFKEHLAAGPPSGQPWSAILLSGGGNDICGDHRFRDWLKPYDGGAHPSDYYITDAFDGELDVLQGIYEEAIALVGKTSKNLRIFVHDYDFAIPDGRCVTGRSPHLRADFRICFAGPWMLPAFEQRGFHKFGDPVSQLINDIVTAILKRFADRLSSLEQKYSNQFILVRTQGTLKPPQDPKLWVNELHPYDDSFELLANPFYIKLRTVL